MHENETRNFTQLEAQGEPSFKTKCIYMLHSAPSHASRFTRDFLALKGLKDFKQIVLPPAFLDVNHIENLWSEVKRILYDAGKQHHHKNLLKEAVKECCKTFSSEAINNLTSSLDDRVV